MAIISSFTVSVAAAALSVAPTNAQSGVPATPDGQAVTTAEMVGAILSYTHWPNGAPSPVRLCVVGPSPWAGRLDDRTLLNGQPMRVARTSQLPPVNQCDAMFIGRIDPPQRQRTVRDVAGRAIVTIEDGGDGCTFGMMFCLRQTVGGMTFDLDIDAVSRSTVRIDPRVLSMGRRTGGRP